MSTRGAFGFVSNGVMKLAYNHSDSYPSGLGVELAEQLAALTKTHDQASLKVLGDLVAVIEDEDTKPTKAQKKKLAAITDLGVGDHSEDDWYCLLRGQQGNLKMILEDTGILVSANTFPEDSLFCEWVYVADFDKMELEVYKGFQEKAHKKGRFAAATLTSEYYPCKLVKTFKIDKDLVENMKKYAKNK